jgi:formylglycine-generating enzyme required for sulfatase activity
MSNWTNSPGTNESRPIVCESWQEAFAFCIWDGGRLATEAERKYAAAGGNEQRVYPWSSPPSSTVIDSSYASYNCTGDGSAAGDCAITDLIIVGSKPRGNGRWGHADLAGNVFEWIQDFSADYVVPCNDCADLNNGTWRIIGGSGYGYDVSYMKSSFRFSLYPGYLRTPDLGVRCVMVP